MDRRKTEESYLGKTKDIMKYFNKPMEKVETEELRNFLLKHLREERKLSERSVNYYNSVIRFMYEVTLDKIINKKQLPMYRKRRKMKDVLTKEELSTFFNACENYMYKTIFMMIYGSGLRVSEAVNLRIEDIDSRKMRIFVRAGKGGKDRYTVLPKTSLEMLRKYYKMYKPKHPEGYIFSAPSRFRPFSSFPLYFFCLYANRISFLCIGSPCHLVIML